MHDFTFWKIEVYYNVILCDSIPVCDISGVIIVNGDGSRCLRICLQGLGEFYQKFINILAIISNCVDVHDKIIVGDFLLLRPLN